MDKVSTVERPKRREYSVEFKASVLEQCRHPGASLAGVALSLGINPNMVHRWIREERQRQLLINLQHTASAFVSLKLQAEVPLDASAVSSLQRPSPVEPAHCAETIHIEIQRGGATVSVRWPLAGAAQCAQVLRELPR